MKKKVTVTVSCLLLVIICVGAAGFFASQPVAVNCFEARLENYSDKYEEDGKIIASEDVPIYITLQAKVLEVNVVEGQPVTAGDVLFKLDDTTLGYELANLQGQKNALLGQQTAEKEKVNRYQIDTQEKQIELAKINLDEAVRKYEKCMALFSEGGMISETEMEDAEYSKIIAERNLEMQKSTLESLKASNWITEGTSQQYEGGLQQIEAQMNMLEYQIEQCTVTSPIDGILYELNLKEGAVTSPGIQVAKVFSKDTYKVEVYVLSDDAVTLTKGIMIDLSRKVNGEKMTYKGTIESIAPTAEETVSTLGLIEQRVKVTAIVEDSYGDDFRPGDELDVTFIAYSRDNSIVVPKDAVFPIEDGEGVWVMKDQVAAIQKIDKAHEAGQNIVVAKGIEEGDLIIYPIKDLNLYEGQQVKWEQ